MFVVVGDVCNSGSSRLNSVYNRISTLINVVTLIRVTLTTIQDCKIEIPVV